MNPLASPRARAWLRRLAPYLSLALIFLLLALARPDSFLTRQNLSNVLRQTAPVAIMAVGETVVIIAAGIDLSIGSVLALAGVMGTCGLKWGLSVPLALSLALVAGGLLGWLNGWLVTRGRAWPFVLTCLLIVTLGELGLRTEALLAARAGTGTWATLLAPIATRLLVTAAISAGLGYFLADLRIPPFIATLGTLGLARGYVLYLTGGMPVVRLPAEFAWLGQGHLLGLPVPAVILAILAVAIHLLLTRTPFGRHVYAIGSNREAARLSGVEVERVTCWTYVICGICAGLAGLIMMARLATGQPTEGQGYELDGIAAVVIGGGSLAGGVGSVAGSVAGALVMALLRNGGTHLNLNDFIQQMIIGGIIILAVGFDEYRRRQALAST